MSRSAFSELGLENYGRLIQQAAEGDCAVAFCDSGGEVLWDSHGRAKQPLADVVARLAEPDAIDTGARVQREELEGNRSLLYMRIFAEPEPEAGQLLVLVETARKRRHGDSLEGTLANVAACIRRECQLTHEVSNLAGELSHRYEELNLVYALEAPASQVDQGKAGFETLLSTLACHLEVDVAALAMSSRRKPIFATNLSQPIPNLDLLLTELRGDLFRFVCMSKQPLVLNGPDEPRRRYLFTHMPYKVLACPIPSAHSVDAVLVLLRHAERPDFENSDRSLASVVATQTAIMMRNQQMLRRMQRFGEQMASALVEAIEAKDPYTRGHSERVQGISVQLGQALGLQAPQLESIGWGSILHDVGKIGIPDIVLSKPCRLTADEYTFVKIHPERSYEIMRHIEYLGQDALDGARYHQERFDGKGYPHGLKGTEIPYLARVIAVADTYDAITSSRAYRAARSHEEAVAEIGKVSGSQLDPDVVRVFEKLCSDDVRWLVQISQRGELHDE